MRIKSYLFLFLLFAFSCAPIIRVTSYDNEKRASKETEISVFSSTQAVPYNYKEIGLITVDDQGWEISESELLTTAINKAKEMGADGILILSQDKELDGYIPVYGVPIAINQRIVRVSAIIKISEKPVPPIQNSISPTLQPSSVADELIKLKKLKDDGVISEDEFQQQKDKLLNN